MSDNFFYSVTCIANDLSAVAGRHTSGRTEIRGPSVTAAAGRQLRGANCRLKLPPYHPTTTHIWPDAARLLCGGGGRTRRPQQARPPTTLYPSLPTTTRTPWPTPQIFPFPFQLSARPPSPPVQLAPTTYLPRVT